MPYPAFREDSSLKSVFGEIQTTRVTSRGNTSRRDLATGSVQLRMLPSNFKKTELPRND